MSLIDRYLMRALARGYLLVAAALLALFSLFDFIEQAGDVGKANFGFDDAITVVLMNLPVQLLELSPFIALLGVVYGLASFVPSHELLAMRACGLTPRRLAAHCGIATALLFVLLAAVEYVARPLAQQAHLLQMTETSEDGALFSSDGIWIQHDGLFVRIESLARGGAPSGIQIYQFDTGAELRRFVSAQRADILAPDRWELRGVVEKRYPDDDPVTTEEHASLPFAPPWNQTTGLYELPMESLSLPQIHAHRSYLAAERRPSSTYDLEFWRRCLMPLSGIVFGLFAAPFVLGVGPRSSMGGAITLGVGIALGIFLAQQIGTNTLLLLSDSAPLAVGVPVLVVLAAALLLIRRVNGPPRR